MLLKPNRQVHLHSVEGLRMLLEHALRCANVSQTVPLADIEYVGVPVVNAGSVRYGLPMLNKRRL
jgi:hypothetical protein